MQNRTVSTLTHSDCTVTERWDGSTVVISCTGVLDMLTAPELDYRVSLALAKNPATLVVDLTDVEFLASHGMNILVATRALCSSATEFGVVADGYVTKRPMELIGLTNVFTVHPTLDAALAAPAV